MLSPRTYAKFKRTLMSALTLAFFCSVMTHVVLFVFVARGVSGLPKIVALKPQELDIDVLDAPVEPGLENAPSEPQAPVPPAARAPVMPTQARATPTAAEAPKDEPIADLTGTTLTNDEGGATWASAKGDGTSSDRPIVTTGSGQHGTALPRASTIAEGPVSPGDLSKAPRQPSNLNDVLERNYPVAARQQEIEGDAKVSMVIGPDGKVSQVNVVSQTWKGFGEACKRTLIGSQWGPPLDKQGNPVSVRVPFTCRFEIRY